MVVNEHMDSSRVNMQTEILSSSNVTPQDHSSQLNLEGEDDDNDDDADDEDANECKVIYTVEFQKRGLPDAHILLFLHEHDKYPTAADIDRIIFAEIPDELADPVYYKAVHNFMMHGPCGSTRKSSPCMQNGRCTKHFPKRFVESTTIDAEGHPIYRRRDNGRTIKKDGIDLDSRPSVKESIFLSWFETNKTLPEARELTYAEFTLKFVWMKQFKSWEKRKTSVFFIGRIFFVPPGTGELYYLRLLLNVIKGPKSYDDLKRINNHNHLTFRDACYALGFLDDDKEYVDAIKEAINWGMSSYLRQLFAMLLLSNSTSRPEYIWQSTWKLLSEDILHEERVFLTNLEADLIDDELKKRRLQKLKKVLKNCGRSFHDFPIMPRPLYNEEEVDHSNRLIHDELHYNHYSLLEEHQQLLINLTVEQKSVYDKIMRVVNEAKGRFFFLYGYGETRRTFIWKTLSSCIRSRGDIVLTIASSGIASLLLSGGRTAHLRFVIPLNPTEDSTCNIKQGSPPANLITKTKLIIWDEEPMIHRYYFEDLDQTFRDILRFKDISMLINLLEVKQLFLVATSDKFCLTLQKDLVIGDGSIGSYIDGIENVQIPDDLLINNYDDLILAIVESTYLDFFNHSSDIDYFQQRAILAPTLNMIPAKRTGEDNGSSVVEVDDDVAQLSSNKIKRVINKRKNP
ncbi:uncharacterized protein [Nicotiana sylvestris]|uniref:uncharacterized protein n=1 Tax=Nicotiana sylvestris TaxID=4096 RepID=UPI00388C9A4F